MKINKILQASALAAGMVLAAPARAADVNVVFLVDESGSMSGEHTFLQTFVPQVESDLMSLGSLSSSYALIGFGSSAVAPHQFTVGSGQFGTAAEFATAATGLQTSGGTEDGYAAIDYALQNLGFDLGAKVSFVLVTDEDRDNTDSSLSYSSILSALQLQGVSLTGILDQNLSDGTGMTTAIATNGTDSYIADGSGGFTTASGVTYDSAYVNTKADYTDLAIATNGCVADLNQLRAGGTTAQSFSGAFLNCLATAIQQQQPGGITEILKGLPLVKVVFVNRQIGIGVGFDYRNRLAVRRVAARNGLAAPVVAFNFDQNGEHLSQSEFADRYGLDGVSGGAAGADGLGSFEKSRLGFFISGHAQVGNLDPTANNAGLDYKVRMVNVGVDYLFPNDALVGVGVGAVRTNADLDGGAGGTDISGTSFTLYGSFAPRGDRWRRYVDATVSLMQLNNDSTRVSGGNTMTGKADSRQVSANVTAGFDHDLSNDLTVSPFVAGSFSRVKVDGYTEAGVTPLTIGENSLDSLTAEVGVQLRKQLPQPSGMLELIGEASVVHEFKNDSHVITVSSGTTVFSSPVDALDPTYGRVGVGLSKTFNGHSTIEVGLTTLIGHSELTAHTLDARLRVPLE